MQTLWQRPRVLIVLTAVGLAMWALVALIFVSLAHAEPSCRVQAMPQVRILPQTEVMALCQMIGARAHAEACARVGTPQTPGLILMPTRETARWYRGAPWSTRDWNWALDHELSHAVCGLVAERH